MASRTFSGSDSAPARRIASFSSTLPIQLPFDVESRSPSASRWRPGAALPSGPALPPATTVGGGGVGLDLVRVAGRADREAVAGALGRDAAALRHVRELVRDQVLARRGARVVCALVEVDVAAGGEGAGVDALRGVGGGAAGVDLHAAEIGAEPGLHLGAHARLERGARARLLRLRDRGAGLLTLDRPLAHGLAVDDEAAGQVAVAGRGARARRRREVGGGPPGGGGALPRALAGRRGRIAIGGLGRRHAGLGGLGALLLGALGALGGLGALGVLAVVRGGGAALARPRGGRHPRDQGLLAGRAAGRRGGAGGGVVTLAEVSRAGRCHPPIIR